MFYPLSVKLFPTTFERLSAARAALALSLLRLSRGRRA